MTAAEMDIIIGADVSKAISAFSKVEKELETTEKTALETSKALNFIPKSFDEISASVTQIATDFHNKWDKIVQDAQSLPPIIDKNIKEFSLLEKQVQKFGGGVAAWDKFTPAAKNAGVVVEKTTKNFTGLSRVIQDLPFGFIAISNNLTQLLPAAGALGLAFSAVVAAITFAQIGFRSWTGTTKEAKEASDEFAKSLKGAEQGALTTGVKLQAFVNIARDNTKSLKERNLALDEANKLMGDHGQKLTLVNINTAAATEEINKFTQALIAEAVAAKFADKVADLIIQQGEASKKYGEVLKTFNKEKEKQNDLQRGASASAFYQSEITSTQVLAKSYGKVVDAANEYKDVTRQLQATTGDFNQQISKSVNLFGEIGTKVKETADKVRHFGADKFQWLIPDFNFQVIPKLSEKIDAFTGKLDIKPILLSFELPDLSKGLKLQRDLEIVTKAIQDTVVNSITAIGETLGNALAGAKNPFGPVLAVLSEGLKTLGKAYIQIGIEAAIASKALKLLMSNPYLTIAAGIALVALGSLLQNKANNVKAFATGGVVTKPTLALVGEQGPERITPLGYEGRANNNWMSGEVVFNISGQNLRGILRRADQAAFNTF